jgi:ABC-type multidrug transport system fused ATPase/permease subunit
MKYTFSKILIKFYTKYPKNFTVLFLITFIEGFLAVMSMVAIMPLADFLLDPELNKTSDFTNTIINLLDFLKFDITFWTLASIFILLNLTKGIFSIGIKYAVLKIKYVVVRGLFNETLVAFFRARYSFFSDSKRGEILSTLNKELNTIGDTFGHLATITAQCLQLLFYFAFPLYLNARITLITITLLILFVSPYYLFKKRIHYLGVQNARTASEALGILTELTSASKLIISFARQNLATKLFLDAFDKHVYVSIKSQLYILALPQIFIPLAMTATILSVGLHVSNDNNLSEIAVVMYSLVSSIPIMSSIIQLNTAVKNFIPSYEQLMDLKSKAIMHKEHVGSLEFNNFKDSIVFSKLDFSYQNGSDVFENLDLVIPKNQITALVGSSGCGKSTIVDLVLGIQKPKKNDQILIDGKSIYEYDLNSYRERIGYVAQEPILFNDTIRNNLLWSKPNSSENELYEALALANAKEFVDELINGIDTIVGDRGSKLSGGQRQRISLARAILRKPEILILDEATSALDTESEIKIQSSVDRISKQITVLIVAHRLSTIINSNNIVVLEKGQVIETGNYENLIKNEEGYFYKMLKKQGLIN